MDKLFLNRPEQVSFALRSIFEKYGYTRYKMSKFEEYDLYARFGDALTSQGVITFTDIGGKLMALKPDVTLSIIKNGRNTTGVQKVYYDEKVYRVPRGGDSFREIAQVGLECMGDIDEYSVAEVLRLAGESLKAIGGGVLDLCHLGIVGSILDSCDVSKADRKEITRLLGEKNLHELENCCKAAGMDETNCAKMMALASTYGKPAQVLNSLASALGAEHLEGLRYLVRLLDTLPIEISSLINIDFSAGTDLGYYNGIVFKGYVMGTPTPVISGGQYDRLMKKMGREGGAVGFAVYPDYLPLEENEGNAEASALLVYSTTDDLSDVAAAAEGLRGKGLKVHTATAKPATQEFKYIYTMENGEVKKLEGDA